MASLFFPSFLPSPIHHPFLFFSLLLPILLFLLTYSPFTPTFISSCPPTLSSSFPISQVLSLMPLLMPLPKPPSQASPLTPLPSLPSHPPSLSPPFPLTPPFSSLALPSTMSPTFKNISTVNTAVKK